MRKSHIPFRAATFAVCLLLLGVGHGSAAGWTTNAPLNTPRAQHSATLLPNGKVLVTGGYNTLNVLSSVELFDPASGAWTPAAALHAARYGHTATLLANGKVLVAGGYYNYGSPLSSAEIYDPANGSWTTTGPLNTSRAYPAATLLSNGKVLIAGGVSASSYLSSTELYDPVAGAWTATGSLTAARAYGTATLLADGKVLAAGGQGTLGGVGSSAEAYNLASGAWTAASPLIAPRGQHTASLLLNGKVLVAGGYYNGSLSSTEVFDPISGTWTPATSMPTAQYRHTATLLPGGNVVLVGGARDTNPYFISTAQIYDPNAGTWTPVGSMSIAREYHTATLLASGAVLVAGGYNGDVLSSVEMYDPASGSSKPQWQAVAIPNLPPGSQLGAVWARTRTEAYVWASLTNSPQSFLFKWNGAAWSQVLALSNHVPGKIFGTGPSDVFVSADFHTNALVGSTFARVYRSTNNGTNWIQQTLPSVITNHELNFGYFGGTPNNVHFHSGDASAYIARFDGTNWNSVFTNSNIYGVTLAGANEGYYVTCSGWGTWNGTNWQSRGFGDIGCDVYGGVWAVRDSGGKLSMYATGQNNFGNGVHVWGFNETDQAWSEVFSDGPGGDGTGGGVGIWGSASNDVYVVGELVSGATHSGQVYHFDGVSWLQVTNIGAIPRPGGVAGTAADDVWVSLGTAGAMLHYAPASPPALAISKAGTNVLVAWPDSAVGYRLETTTRLSPTATWYPVTNLANHIINQYRISSPITNGSQFFRLVHP